MLRLFRVGSRALSATVPVRCYKDEDLIDIRFDHSSEGVALRPLTKFRRRRKSGAIVSLEMRAGVLCGIEMLGVAPGRWDTTQEAFSEDFSVVDELPLIGMELDGENTKAELGIMTIDQPGEFSVRWGKVGSVLEIAFDEFVSASRFGDAMTLYNKNDQVAGVRIVVTTL